MLEVKYTALVEKINSFLSEEFEVDQSEISAEGNMKEVLDLDSLDYVDLVVSVESNFSVKLDAEDFVSVITLQNFYDLIEEKVNY